MNNKNRNTNKNQRVKMAKHVENGSLAHTETKIILF